MILEAVNKKEITAQVLLNLYQVFDSLDHSLLLAKLRVLGLSNVSLDWFKSYLLE